MRSFKWFAFALAAVAVAALFGSCFSTGGYSRDSAPSYAAPKVPALAAGEVVSLDVVRPAGAPAEIGRYWMMNAVTTVLDRFDLHEALGIDAKRSLMEGLFGSIPAGPADAPVNEVWIGKCIGGKDDLGFRTMTVELNPGAKAKGGLYAYLVVSNAVKLKAKDGKISFMTTSMFSTELNQGFLFIVGKGGKLFTASYLSSPEREAGVKKEAAGDAAMEAINLADLYLNDQFDDNDAGIPGLLEPVYADASLPAETRIAAGINLFQQKLAVGDLGAAATLLGELATLGADVAEPSIVLAIKTIAPAMLALMQEPAIAD